VGLLVAAVLFWSCSNAVATELLSIELAVKNAPFLAVFEDFLFHGRDLLAGFDVPLLFFAKLVRKNGDNLLTDGVAVFDEFDLVACDKDVHHFVRQPDNFFSRKSHLPFS